MLVSGIQQSNSVHNCFQIHSTELYHKACSKSFFSFLKYNIVKVSSKSKIGSQNFQCHQCNISDHRDEESAKWMFKYKNLQKVNYFKEWDFWFTDTHFESTIIYTVYLFWQNNIAIILAINNVSEQGIIEQCLKSHDKVKRTLALCFKFWPYLLPYVWP